MADAASYYPGPGGPENIRSGDRNYWGDWPDDQPIDNDWLKSIGFVHYQGTMDQLLRIALHGCSLETWPEFINAEGNRRWDIIRNGQHGMIPGPLKPKTRAAVLLLFRLIQMNMDQ